MAKIKIEIDTEEATQHQYHGGESIRVSARPKVLLVSSIPLSPEFSTNFSNGLSGSADQLVPWSNLGYIGGSTAAIETAIQNNHGPAHLVVTAGGLVSHLAAKNTAGGHTKGYVSLMGSVPVDDTDQELDRDDYFRGAIILGSYESNSERVQILLDKGLNPQQMTLLTNGNSKMNAAEVRHWNGLGCQNVRAVTGNNNPLGWQTDFNNLGGGIRGVVISGDPFFQQAKESLITAANAWLAAGNRYVIYPSLAFENTGHTQPSAGSILYGPDLSNAYMLLGQLARAALLLKNRGDFAGYWPVKDKRKNF
jgi:hypothetical protein